MSRLAERIIDLPLYDDIEESVDEVLRLSGGDARTAIRAVILGQRSVMEVYAGVVSAGYVRKGSGKRR